MLAVKSKAGCLFLKDTSGEEQESATPDLQAACVFLKDENGVIRLKKREQAGCLFLKSVEEKPKTAGCLFLKSAEEKPQPAGCLFLKGAEERSEQNKAGCLFLKSTEEKPKPAGCLFLKGEEMPEQGKAGCLFLRDESAQQARPEDVAIYFDRFAAWDLSRVKRQAVRKGLFRADEIDAVELEYKRFMALGCVYGSNAVPLSQRIDDFWHTHILFTEDYAAMCLAVAGQFLHHRPTLEEDESETGGATGFALYEASFGAPSKAWW
jgi:hypothetical protein